MKVQNPDDRDLFARCERLRVAVYRFSCEMTRDPQSTRTRDAAMELAECFKGRNDNAVFSVIMGLRGRVRRRAWLAVIGWAAFAYMVVTQ